MNGNPMNSVNRHSHITIILLSILVGAVLTGLVIYSPRAHQDAVAQAPVPGMGTAREFESALVGVAERTLPAVVSISVETEKMAPQFDMNPFKDLPFDFGPFGPGQNEGKDGKQPKEQQKQKGRGVGSGWIVRDDGYIVTNSHVIRDATKISVRLYDKDNDETQYPAKLVGNDPRTELAVIKIETKRKLPTLSLGSSKDAKVGQFVAAVGAPFELDQTFTFGIISAKGRLLPGQNEFIRIGDIIQTDASINPGNSGGPLVNLDGDVVGINVAIVSNSPTPGNVGIGFAIPADTARYVIEELITNKKVARGWLGINIQDLNENMRGFYNAPDGGALVEGVTEGGPAAASDLQIDDVIIGVDGDKVTSTWELQRAVSNRKPGTEIMLDVVRDGNPIQVRLKIGEMPAKYTGLEEEATEVAVPDKSELGVTVSNITDELKKQLAIKFDNGVVITDIDMAGPSAEKLAVGDVITHINRTAINNVDDLKKAMAGAKNSEQGFVILKIMRRAGDEWQRLTFDITPAW